MLAMTVVPPGQDDPPPRSGELFRQEAVAEYVRGFEAAGELEISRFWLSWAFWLLVGLLALAAAGASLYRFEEEVPAVWAGAADEPEMRLLLPERMRSRLAPAREIVVDPPGERLVIRQVGERPLDAAEVRRMLAVPAGGVLAVETPAVLVTAACAGGAGSCGSPAPGSRGVVRLGAESLASVALPAFRRRRAGDD